MMMGINYITCWEKGIKEEVKWTQEQKGGGKREEGRKESKISIIR